MPAAPPAPTPPRPRFLLFRALVWLTILAAFLAFTFAYALPARLADTSRAYTLASLAAFMVRTFTFHAGLALLLIALAAFALRQRRALIAAAGLAIFALAPTLWSLRPRATPPPSTAPRLTVMSANLLVGHADVAPVLDAIAAHDPDVICFQEYTPDKSARLRPALADRYPHVIEALRDDAFGQATYSKLPFVQPPILYPPAELRDHARAGGIVGLRNPQIRAVLSLDNREVVVQNIHLVPPVGIAYHAEQRQMTQWLADWARSESRPTILAGDFNATPESVLLRTLHDAGLRSAHAAVAPGRGATWPDQSFLRFFPGVRIDHILATRHLRPVASRVTRSIASDHRAIVATYELADR